jgi:3-oxoacyl-(acyl-carrier-protein) synthase/acyl carrier protein
MDESTIQSIVDKLATNEITEDEALDLLLKSTDLTQKNHGSNTYKVQFKYNDPSLRDHLIFDMPVLLGATYCSLAIEAFKKFYPGKTLNSIKQCSFLEPIVFNSNDTVDVIVTISIKNTDYVFEVNFLNNMTNASGLAAKGVYVIDNVNQDSTGSINIEEYVSNVSKILNMEEIYKPTKSVVHLSALKTLKQIYIASTGNLGKLETTEEILQSSPSYFFHPTLLDGACVCALSANLAIGTKPFVPYFIKEINLTQFAIPVSCNCLTQVIKMTEDMIICNIQYCNDDGKILATINGVTFKKTDESNFLKAKQVNTDFNIHSTEKMFVQKRENFMDDKNVEQLIGHYLINKLAKLLVITSDQINTTLNFIALGLDSVQMVSVSRDIETEVGIELYPTLFFEYSTVDDLAGYFIAEHKDKFSDYFKSHNLIMNISTADNSSKPDQLLAKDLQNLSFTDRSNVSKSIDLLPDHVSTLNREISDDIAVIGMSGIFPHAENLDQFSENLFNGLDFVEEIPLSHWDYRPWFDDNSKSNDKIYCKWGSFIKDVDKFDAAFFDISEEEAKVMDPQIRLLLQTLYSTADDAGYSTAIRGSKTGLYVGSSFRDYIDSMVDNQAKIGTYGVVGNANTMMANRASFYFNLSGPSIMLDTSCSSSLVALNLACQSLKSGECDTAFVAGVNLILSPRHYQMFCLLNVLSPSGRCHSFDEASDGYVPAETVAAVLLKPLNKALADGDQVHAIIKGTAVRHGGYTSSVTAPNPQRQAEVMLQSWKNAGIDPRTISYIEAHATGTKLGDPIEMQAIKKAFAQVTQDKDFCAVGSLKGHMGHAEAAAGIASLIKVILSMKKKKMPVLPNFKKLNSMINLEDGPVYINTKVKDWEAINNQPRRSGINSFGFGGTYAHVLIEEFPNNENGVYQAPTIMQKLVIFSAKSEDSLKQQVINLESYLARIVSNIKTNEEASKLLSNIAYTLQVGRENMNVRVAFIINSIDDLSQKIKEFLNNRVENPHIIVGNKNNEKFNLVISGKAGQLYLETILQEKDLVALAQLWAIGANIDWKLLYDQSALPNKISLPSYPFAKKRYWYDISQKPLSIDKTFTDNEKINPFLSREFESLEFIASDFLKSDALDSKNPINKPKKIGSKAIKSWLGEELAKLTNLTSEDIDPDRYFEELGINSIDMIALYNRLTQFLGWVIPPGAFQEARTINTLAKYAISVKNSVLQKELDKIDAVL